MTKHDKRLRLLEDLRSVEAYTAVVEAGSITRAASRLGITPSTVSKKIAELESRACATLLHRTTRRLSVTDLGQRFYEQCLRLLDEAERAEWELRDQGREPGGSIRVTAPVVFAQRQISPLLAGFMVAYPRISLELVASAQTVNLVAEGIDVSIRLIRVGEIGRTGRVLVPNRRVFCASPDYLARRGEPRHPSELAHHDCIVALTGQRTDAWRYAGTDGPGMVRVRARLASDNVAVVAKAAEDGVGIAIAGTAVVGDELRSGRLREVLPGCMVQDWVVAAIVPARGFVPHRVDLLVNHLARGFGDPPVWDAGLPTS